MKYLQEQFLWLLYEVSLARILCSTFAEGEFIILCDWIGATERGRSSSSRQSLQLLQPLTSPQPEQGQSSPTCLVTFQKPVCAGGHRWQLCRWHLCPPHTAPSLLTAQSVLNPSRSLAAAGLSRWRSALLNHAKGCWTTRILLLRSLKFPQAFLRERGN